MNECPTPARMCPLDVNELKHMSAKIDQIHAFLFGVESQGGMVRKVEIMEKRVSELETFKTRIVGWSVGVSSGMTFLGTKIYDWLSK